MRKAKETIHYSSVSMPLQKVCLEFCVPLVKVIRFGTTVFSSLSCLACRLRPASLARSSALFFLPHAVASHIPVAVPTVSLRTRAALLEF